MTEHERKELKVKRDNSRLNPEIKTLRAGAVIMNAERTGDDDAAIGSSWKEYWQIFTQNDFPHVCPLCGHRLAKGDIDGCHIRIYHQDTKRWTLRKFIVPGHHGCNVSIKGDFQMQTGETVVEAIEK